MEDNKVNELEGQELKLGPLYDKIKELENINRDKFANNQKLAVVQMNDVFSKISDRGNFSVDDPDLKIPELKKNIVKIYGIMHNIFVTDIYKNGNLTKREAEAARLINLKIIREGEGNPQLITIPKGQGTGNIEKILKKIEEDIEKDTK